MKKILALITAVSTLSLNAGNPRGLISESTKDVFGTRVFVENKGQFVNPINTETIKYGFENGSDRIYFTPKGLIYKLVKGFPLSERAREKMEEGKTVKAKPDEIHYIQMNWVNSNSN